MTTSSVGTTFRPTANYPHWMPDLPEGAARGAISPDVFHPPPVARAGGDYEQDLPAGVEDAVGGYAELYVLAALEPNRCMVQILHEFDSCCFRAAGLFDEIKSYNAWVQPQVKGGRRDCVLCAVCCVLHHPAMCAVRFGVLHGVPRGAFSRTSLVTTPFPLLLVARLETMSGDAPAG